MLYSLKEFRKKAENFDVYFKIHSVIRIDEDDIFK